MAANETTTPTGQAALLRELGILIAPLEDLQSGMAAAQLVRELGYDFPLATAFPVDFASLLEDVEQVAEDVVALEQASDDDEQLDAAIQLAVDLVPLIEAIVKLEQDLEDGLAAMQTLLTQSDITTQLPVRLLDYLVIRYLIERGGPTFDLLLLAGLVDFVHQEADKPKFKLEALIPKVYWERLPKMFTSPSALLDEAYDWSTNFNAELTAVRLAGAGRRLGLPMGTAPQSDAVRTALGRPEGAHEVRLALLQAGQLVPAAAYGELGLRAFALPPTGNLAPGIAVMPYAAGAGAVTGRIGSWDIELDTTLDLSGGVAAIVRPPKFLEVKTDLVGTPGTTTSATLGLKVSRKSDSPDGMILLGSPGATRMSVGEFGLGFATSLGTQNEVVFEISIVDLLILVVAGDGDGFLQKMLPGRRHQGAGLSRRLLLQPARAEAQGQRQPRGRPADRSGDRGHHPHRRPDRRTGASPSPAQPGACRERRVVDRTGGGQRGGHWDPRGPRAEGRQQRQRRAALGPRRVQAADRPWGFRGRRAGDGRRLRLLRRRQGGVRRGTRARGSRRSPSSRSACSPPRCPTARRASR